MVTGVDQVDPAQLPLQELRARRADLQAFDDVVSYVRRVAQARLDLIDAELARRANGDDAAAEGDLRLVLGQHLTGGPARPPRPADDASEHPLAVTFESMCLERGIADIQHLDDDELRELRDAIRAVEQERSVERQDLFQRIDALSAELVRRYRDGEADVDGLLAEG